MRGAQQSLAACIPGFPREDDHSTAATCGEDETKPRLDLVPSFGKWSYDDLNSIVGWDTHHGLSLYLANWVKNPNPKLEDRSSADPTRPCCLDTWDTMNPVNALKPHRLRGHIMAISRWPHWKYRFVPTGKGTDPRWVFFWCDNYSHLLIYNPCLCFIYIPGLENEMFTRLDKVRIKLYKVQLLCRDIPSIFWFSSLSFRLPPSSKGWVTGFLANEARWCWATGPAR